MDNTVTFVNGQIIQESCVLENYCLELCNQQITGLYERGSRTPKGYVIDLAGDYISAGLIDLHVHGGGGSDFMDGTTEAFREALHMHMGHGTTSIAPTTLTATAEELAAVAEAYGKFKASEEASSLPNLLGLHLEGPFIAPSMNGAQDESYIRPPTPEEYMGILNIMNGNILIWTVAPELDGAIEMCRSLKDKGIYFSMGHSEAQYKHVMRAVENGYTRVTHLFSGMSTIIRENGYRKLGLVESALLMDEIIAEVIADGEHLPIELLKLIYKNKGEDGMLLVTDAMRGAGMPKGKYKLGSLSKGQLVDVDKDIARMPDGISFAGSVATADRLVRVMYKGVGLPIYTAVKMMTINPARSVGIFGKKGSVEIGKDADLIIFDDDININRVIIGGKMI